MFHPSYQEQNINSRRRRRRRPSDLLLKEERGEKVLINNNAQDADLDYEYTTNSVPQPTREREERKERTARPSRREEPIIERERVSVEMSPIEQEVYSMMGISPLLLLEREFKDPKSVIVSIKPQGETEPPEISMAPVVNDPAPVAVTETQAPVEEDEGEMPEEALDNGDTDSDRPVIRRRRRRSSADS